MPAIPAAAWALTLPTFNQRVAFPQAAGVGLLAVALAVCAASLLLARAGMAWVDTRDAGGRARAQRACAIAAIALVAVGAVAFTVRSGGPLDAGRNVWEGVAGKKQEVVGSPGQRFTSLASNKRYQWWGQAWDAFTARPVSGQGAGSFTVVDQLTRPDRSGAGEPHSAALQVLAGLGLAGGAAALTALICAALAALAGIRRLAGDARAAGAAVFAGVVAYTAQAQIDWTWNFLTLTVLVYAGAGALASAGLPPLPRSSLAQDRRIAGVAVPALLLAAACAALPYLSARALERAGDWEVRGDPDRALVEADLALSLWPVSTQALFERATLLQELGQEQRSADTLRRAVELEPYSYQTWMRAGQALRDCWNAPPRAWRPNLEAAVELSGHMLTSIEDVGRICDAPPPTSTAPA